MLLNWRAMQETSLADIDAQIANLQAIRIPLPDPRLPLAVAGVIAPDAPAWRQALNDYWRPIARGPFWHGDDRSEQLQEVAITHDYAIARYPITNADFARFVAAGGYAEQRWWTMHG
jgi:formylglycine-generating enzyme required for sulfatase activity